MSRTYVCVSCAAVFALAGADRPRLEITPIWTWWDGDVRREVPVHPPDAPRLAICGECAFQNQRILLALERDADRTTHH